MRAVGRFRREVLCGIAVWLAIVGLIMGWPDATAHAEEAAPPPPKVIYLTFDDGPSPDTPKVLDLLNQYHAKATFFMVGRQAAAHPDIVNRVDAEGNGIGSHTWAHGSLAAMSATRLRDDLAATNAALGGRDHRCLRPPYGAVSRAALAAVSKLDYSVIRWTVDPRDWSRPGVDAIVSRVLKRVYPGAIILLHDGPGTREQTVAALARILDKLSAEGYTFAPLCRSDLPLPEGEGSAIVMPAPALAVAVAPASAAPGRAVTANAVPVKTGPAAVAAVGPASILSSGIVAPRPEDRLRGTVSVSGVASHPGFKKWQLDLLVDGKREVFLAVGNGEVAAPAELARIDTTLYPNGRHLLRLRVVYTGANYDEFSVLVTIAN